MKNLKRFTRCGFLLGGWLIHSVAPAQGFTACPDHRAGGYGPYDYTSPVDKVEHLPIVEQAHFRPDVENLVSGSTSNVAADLD